MAAEQVQTVIHAASVPHWWDRMEQAYTGWCPADTPPDGHEVHDFQGCYRQEGHTGRHLGIAYRRQGHTEVMVVWGERYTPKARPQLATICGAVHPTIPDATPCQRLPGHTDYDPPHFSAVPKAAWVDGQPTCPLCGRRRIQGNKCPESFHFLTVALRHQSRADWLNQL